jgi:hypothetical protein
MKLPNQSVNVIRSTSVQPVIQAVHPARSARLVPLLPRNLGFTLSPERPPEDCGETCSCEISGTGKGIARFIVNNCLSAVTIGETTSGFGCCSPD